MDRRLFAAAGVQQPGRLQTRLPAPQHTRSLFVCVVLVTCLNARPARYYCCCCCCCIRDCCPANNTAGAQVSRVAAGMGLFYFKTA